MSKNTILSFYNNGHVGLTSLEQEFNVIKLFDEKDPDTAIDAVKNDVVAINCTVGQFITRDLIEKLPNLKIIATFSVGFDHVDLEAAKEHGVKVTNTPDVLSAETADTGMALLLATARRVVFDDKYVRAGKWATEGDSPLSTSLTNKKVGIVGLGGIGQKVAKRCAAFEMDVVYYGPREKPDQPYSYYNDLIKMASDCDYMILTCPGGAATKHLVNAPVLASLGSEGMLINISRGSVVDEDALISALDRGIIKAAGLDVFADEPNIPQALIDMDHVVLLPHIGSASVETRIAMGQLVVDNIKAYFHGEPLLTEVII